MPLHPSGGLTLNYWLDLFTGTTWREFREAGASVSGFRPIRHKTVERIKPGDILLCYLTGVMRWVGALEVIGQSNDTRRIWNYDEFPARLDVKPLILLDPEYGLPMKRLEGKVHFYEGSIDAGKFKGFLRGSPARFENQADGILILNMLNEAKDNPVSIPVDARKLERKPLFRTKSKVGDQKIETVVSVPGAEEAAEDAECISATEIDQVPTGTDHTRIQYLLLTLGPKWDLMFG
jgi:hypothetical protein